jgi:peptide deformylase
LKESKILAPTHELIYYGHETLKKVAGEVANVDGGVVQLMDVMYNVMYGAKGIGLAAPQIDESKRILILDLGDRGDISLELVNPVIKEFSDKTEPYDEGCLSIPGISREIIRPSAILVAGVNRDGNEVELEAEGLLARVIQHEVDHLNGILFIDMLQDFERNELRQELKKIKKLNRHP